MATATRPSHRFGGPLRWGVCAALALSVAGIASSAQANLERPAASAPGHQVWAFSASQGSPGPWSAAELSPPTLPAVSATPSMLATASGVELATTTTTGHLVVLAGAAGSAPWSATDLTDLLALPSVSGTPVLVADASGATTIIVRTTSGHLVEVAQRYVDRQPYQVLDLTALAGAPLSAGTPAVSVTAQGTEIFYRTTTDHLAEVTDQVLRTAPWRAYDLTREAGGPLISSDPSVAVEPSGPLHVVAALGAGAAAGKATIYVDDNLTARVWSVRTPAPGTGLVGRPSVVVANHVAWVFARSASGDLVALNGPASPATATWTSTDLTQSTTGGPTIAADPSAAVGPSGIEVVARSTYGDLFDLHAPLSGASFEALDLRSTATFAPLTGAVSVTTLGSQVLVSAIGASTISAAGTGVYAISPTNYARAITDGWPVLGVTGALGTPSSPYTGAQMGQDLLVGRAVAAAAKPESWLSFWTVSGPPVAVTVDSVSCSTVCAGVGSYADLAGATRGLVLTGTAAGTTAATTAPAPTGAPPNPLEHLHGVSCPSASTCIAVGEFHDLNGRTEALWTTLGSSGSAHGLTPPAGAAANPQSTLVAISCPSPSSCVAVGHYLDAAGRTQADATAMVNGVFAPLHQLSAPVGASSNPRTMPTAIACTSAQHCIGVGSFVDAAGRIRPVELPLGLGAAGSARVASLPPGTAANPSAALRAVSCAAEACLAVGTSLDHTGRLEAYSTNLTPSIFGSSAWVAPPAHSAANPNMAVSSISCASTTTCVMVGSAVDLAGRTEGFSTTFVRRAVAAASFLGAPTGSAANPEAAVTAVACPASGTCLLLGQGVTLGGDPEIFDAAMAAGHLSPAAVATLPKSASAASPTQAFYQAGAAAGRFVGSTIATYPSHGVASRPDFVILDPEGYPDLHSGLDGPAVAASVNKWTAILRGWSDGLHGIDPRLRPGVYADQYEYRTYGLSKFAIPAFLAVAWGQQLGTDARTGAAVLLHAPAPPAHLVSGPNVEGIISFNDWCPAEDPHHYGTFATQTQMFNKAPWNGTYNTIQFLSGSDYCAPSP